MKIPIRTVAAIVVTLAVLSAAAHFVLGRPQELSAEQRTAVHEAMKGVRERAEERGEASRAALEEILTPEQRQQLASRPDEGRRGRHRDRFADLDLTAEQQAKIDALREADKAAMRADMQSALDGVQPTLTDEQKAELMEHGGRKGRGGHGRRGPGGRH